MSENVFGLKSQDIYLDHFTKFQRRKKQLLPIHLEKKFYLYPTFEVVEKNLQKLVADKHNS